MANQAYARCLVCGSAVTEKPDTIQATHVAYNDLTHEPCGTCIDCGRTTKTLAAGAWLCRGHTITVARSSNNG